MKPAIFGAIFGPLPDDLRSTLQRNTGAYVTIVMNDSPAFKANIMRGDVVVELANKPVSSFQEVVDLLPGFAGQQVNVKVFRGSQTLDITVQLNPNL